MERRKPYVQEEEIVTRVPTPKNNEVLGIVEQRVGGSRMLVRCFDSKVRNCRIPGRLKRKLWIRENDVVIVEPWEYSGDEKGDVIYKYTPTQMYFLRKKGYLKELDNFDEF